MATPLIPRTAIVLTLTNYAGAATLNFNYKASVASHEEVAQLVDVFHRELAQFVAAQPTTGGAVPS